MTTDAAASPAPAPVTTAEPAPASGPAAPAPVVAHDDLQAAVAAHTAQIRAQAGRTDVPAEVALLENRPAPAAEATPPATEQPGEAAAKPPEAQPAKEEPAKEADPVAANIAKYIEQQRLAKAAQKRAEEAQRAAEAATRAAEAERAERAKEQSLRDLAKTNPVAAARALLGDETLRGGFVVDLLNQLEAGENGQPAQLTPEQREEQEKARIRAVLKAERDAEAQKQREAAEEAQRKQAEANARGREAFFSGLAEQFKANKDQYPYLQAEPVDVPVVDQWLQEEFHRTQRIPTPAEIFAHFEKVQEERALRLAAIVQKRTGGATPVAAPPAPAKTTAAAAPVPRALDTRGTAPAASAKDGAPSFRQQRDEIARRLDQQRA